MTINNETTICVYGPEEQYIPFMLELIELAFKKPKEVDLKEISDTMVLYTKKKEHRIYSGVMERLNNHIGFALTEINEVQKLTKRFPSVFVLGETVNQYGKRVDFRFKKGAFLRNVNDNNEYDYLDQLMSTEWDCKQYEYIPKKKRVANSRY